MNTAEPELNFTIYTYKVLKQVHPDTGITSGANTQMNVIINAIGENLSEKAVFLATKAKRKTISTKDIQSAVRLVLPDYLSKYAVSEGTKAVTKYLDLEIQGLRRGKRGKRSARAGLQFPVSRVEKFVRAAANKGSLDSSCKKGGCLRVTDTTGVYLAGAIEYLVAEILELSGNAARDNKKARITSRHLFLGIANDEELNKMMETLNIFIPNAGVLPHIHSALLPKRRR